MLSDLLLLCRLLTARGKNELLATDQVDIVDADTLNGISTFAIFSIFLRFIAFSLF